MNDFYICVVEHKYSLQVEEIIPLSKYQKNISFPSSLPMFSKNISKFVNLLYASQGRIKEFGGPG
jgi:hypothetical protein